MSSGLAFSRDLGVETYRSDSIVFPVQMNFSSEPVSFRERYTRSSAARSYVFRQLGFVGELKR